MTEDEMAGWHHRLNRHEFEQAPGVGNGQGSLACCSPWGHKESDTTEQLEMMSQNKTCKTDQFLPYATYSTSWLNTKLKKAKRMNWTYQHSV